MKGNSSFDLSPGKCTEKIVGLEAKILGFLSRLMDKIELEKVGRIFGVYSRPSRTCLGVESLYFFFKCAH